MYPLLLIPFLLRSQQPRQDTLILHFPFDSYQIQPADRAVLATIKTKSADSIQIIGYTDKVGTHAYNQRLSQQRAAAAANLLGIGPAQTTGAGVAPTPDRTDSDNRRVEIIIYNPPVSHYDTVTRSRPTPKATNETTPNNAIVVVKSTAADSSAADSAHPATILALHHINFIVDTPIPTDSTRNILPQLIMELDRFKNHHLEIDGYVNSLTPLRGPKDPLFILSVNRAKFIYDYLVNAGFDPATLSYKGMGNATPVNPNPTTKAEMNANMRVEIKVY